MVNGFGADVTKKIRNRVWGIALDQIRTNPVGEVGFGIESES